MGLPERQQCPVPFKLGHIYDKQDFYGIEEEDLAIFNGLADLELLFMLYEWESYGFSTKNVPSVNGWTLKYKKGVNRYKQHGMEVYVVEFNKENNTVYIINEDQWADQGNVDLSAFADDEKALLAFKKDFNIIGKVKATTFVEQTI